MVKKGIEEALQIVGSFGRFQALCFISLATFQIFLGWQMVQMVFVGATPTVNTSSREVTKVEGQETIVSEWNLYGSKWIINTIQSVFMFGVMVGNFVFGQLSDTYGRKSVLYKVFGLLILSSFLTSFANNYQVFAALRFFVGVFQGGSVLVSFVLAQELLGSSVWTITGNVMPAMFALGVASLAGIASKCLNWRDLCWATSLPGFLIWLSIFYVPESPRWLFSQGKVSQAEEVLQLIAQKNGVSESKYNQIALLASEKKRKAYTLKDLFSSKSLTTRTLVMGYLWFVCSFTYYGLTMGASDLSSNIFTSVALSGLVELPAYVICMYLISKPWAGRRKSLCGMLLFCGFSCALILFVPLDKTGKSKIKLGMALAGKLAISASFAIVYIYASELFPTVIRNVGMGTSSVCARIGGILAPFVLTLTSIAFSLPYIVYGLAAVLAGFLALLLPETLNQPIPDTPDDLKVARPKQGFTNKSYVAEEETGLL